MSHAFDLARRRASLGVTRQTFRQHLDRLGVTIVPAGDR
jgi:hypothetical protein